MKRLSLLIGLILAVFVVAARADDTPGELPNDIRWRDNSANFFFVNSSDLSLFWHAFVTATTRWQPGDFSYAVTGDASNNTPCRKRPSGVKIVNIAQFASTVCANMAYGPDVLAVTYVQWDEATREIWAADMFFNTAYIWGIYDGTLFQPPFNNRPDFIRVAAHELGHAGGLSHSPDQADIMYRLISNVDHPSANDTSRLKSRYAGQLPPGPPGPFSCPSSIPYSPSVDLGTLQSSTYRLQECLDPRRPQTIFHFQLSSPRRINISVGADVAELNVDFSRGAEHLWRAINTGTLKKSKVLDLPAGTYDLNVWRDTAGSTYGVAFEFQ